MYRICFVGGRKPTERDCFFLLRCLLSVSVSFSTVKDSRRIHFIEHESWKVSAGISILSLRNVKMFVVKYKRDFKLIVYVVNIVITIYTSPHSSTIAI